ncbi:hypothetical protein BD779DRAFT_1802002 [Infundibulicybe gibba]|nr:hypothetical protein BD779DRAFT_1802002 [Infundibulicybe gibba]
MDHNPRHPRGVSQQSAVYPPPAPMTPQYSSHSNEFNPYESQTYPSPHTHYSSIGSNPHQYSPLLPNQDDPMSQPLYRIPTDDKTPVPPSASTVQFPFDSMFSRGPPSTLAKKHPFARTFEPPNWRLLITHTVLCLLAYPVLLVFIIIAGGKTLFWTRFLVSAGCGLVGFFLGFNLLQLGKGFLEASTWATVIHQSRVPNHPGVRLRDLAARSDDPTSAWSAVRLLWDRSVYLGTSRKSRKSYDTRPWSIYIFFFLFLVVAAASLPFLFGRLVTITTTVAHQSQYYHEVAVMGDLSADDIAKAVSLAPAFEDYSLTWTLSPFRPMADYLQLSHSDGIWRMASGSGFGTFETATKLPEKEIKGGEKTKATVNDPSKPVDPGNVLRYPRWGIRIHCTKLPDPSINIVPRSDNNFTYTFTPRATLRSLFDSFKLPFPAKLEVPVNGSKVLQRMIRSLLAWMLLPRLSVVTAFYDNGVGHSFQSTPLSMGEDGNGWVTLESVLVRLNMTYTPDGKFGKLSNMTVPDVKGQPTHIGYDSAICLELYEPWIWRRNEITDQNTPRQIERNTGLRLTDPNIKRRLNSTNLSRAYVTAHTNSVNQMLKDNGRDAFYVPSPTVISFTTGQGPNGYTELSPEAFAQARAQADASNVLPYFAGTGPVVARSYPDRVMSSAAIQPIEMAIALGAIFILGWVAGMFVPKLPLGVPRRGFELYSWLAAFHADELVGERGPGLARNMELADIQERPSTIDLTKSGSIEVKRGSEFNNVTVEHPTTQPGEGVAFIGPEHSAKEWECVLIYDEETGTFTLEKLDSHLSLTFDRRTTVPIRTAASPSVATPISPKEPDITQELEEEIERGLAEPDADGDLDDEFEQLLPKSLTQRSQELEEGEEEEIFIPPAPAPAPAPAPPAPKSKPARPVKTLPKRPVEPPVTAPKPKPPAPEPKPAPPRAKKAKREPEPPLLNPDVEVLQFGKPTEPARQSPPREGLALPGMSATFAPPPPVTLPPSSLKTDPPYTPAVPSPVLVDESEEEEEWDEVEPHGETSMAVDDDIFGGDPEEGEEIDMNDFARELNEQMEESDEDFLAAAVSPEPEAPRPTGQPISLKQFAGGDLSEDEYSSSEESDED